MPAALPSPGPLLPGRLLPGPLLPAVRAPVAALLDVLAPDGCPGCGELPRAPGTRLCPACDLEAPRLPRPLDLPEPLAWGVALGPYDGPLGAMVRQGKYRPDPGCFAELGARLAAALGGPGAPRLPAVDALVPVPVPPRRRLHRGFDQGELLARILGRHLGIAVLPALRRVRSAEQAGRSAGDRARAARGAFRVRAGRRLPARVALVDDVVTTGASARACADELLCAGPRRVGVLAVTSALL